MHIDLTYWMPRRVCIVLRIFFYCFYLTLEIRVHKQHDPLFIIFYFHSFSASASNSIQYFNMRIYLKDRTKICTLEIRMTWKLLQMQMTVERRKIDRESLKLHFTICSTGNVHNAHNFINPNIQITWRSLEFQLFVYISVLYFTLQIFILCVIVIAIGVIIVLPYVCHRYSFVSVSVCVFECAH